MLRPPTESPRRELARTGRLAQSGFGALVILAVILPVPRLSEAQSPTLESLREQASQRRRDLEAQTSYAAALTRRQRFRRARSVLRAARHLDSEGAIIPFELARVAFTEGSYHRTRAACRAMMTEQPALGHVCKARAFLLRNRAARAFEELNEAIELSPNEFEAWLALGEAHRLRAEVRRAERAFREAIRLDRESPLPHAGLGHLYVAASRNDAAVAAFRKALQRDPHDPDTLFALSRLVDRVERRDLLERAVTVRPQWADALTAYGVALGAAGQMRDALQALERAVEVDAQQTEAHIALGQLHLSGGRYTDATSSFERALAIVPNATAARMGLAEVLAASGQIERAFAAYQTASSVDPSDPEAHLRAARLALRTGRDVLAAAFLDRVLEKHPNLAAAHALYGDVMTTRGDANSARRHYERALRGEGAVDASDVNEALRGLDRIASSSAVR